MPIGSPISFALPDPKALKKLGDFSFREVAGRYLVTNDWGRYVLLTPEEFRDFVAGRLDSAKPVWQKLKEGGFIKGKENKAELIRSFRGLKNHLWNAPGLHIIVVTLRCNLKCVYCHSSVVGREQTQFDMTEETARKSVDLIFSSPSPRLTIEFQGGEPLMNWPIIKFIVEYSRKKAKKEKRNLSIALISNLSLMNEERMSFLITNHVSLSTSLDGPEALHNANRIALGGVSHADVTRWIKHYREKTRGGIGALMTTTKKSLSYPKEIVNEYRSLGLKELFLRPLHYLGFAKRSWVAIGYEDSQYIEFYRKAMDYILDLNRSGEYFRESSSAMILSKILNSWDSGYVDLRSPCGATLGQISYNYDGDVYTCDEGRMVAAEGDKIFRIGNVKTSDYPSLVNHATTRACCSASNIEGQPLCFSCAYKPYCGICPVLNYATQNTIWGRMPTNSYCYIFMHIFDYLFEKLADPENEKIFQGWVKSGARKKSIAAPSCMGEIAGKRV